MNDEFTQDDYSDEELFEDVKAALTGHVVGVLDTGEGTLMLCYADGHTVELSHAGGIVFEVVELPRC